MTTICRVPVFPLDGVILCPNAFLPLHIFEERYRAMLRFAVEHCDGRMAMVQPASGHTTNSDIDPPLDPVGGIGHVIQQDTLPDGRSNILLQGDSRIRIVREIDIDADFRVVEAELLPELVHEGLEFDQARQEMLRLIPHQSEIHAELADELLQMPDQELVDTVMMVVDMPSEVRWTLYSEQRVDLRMAALVELMRGPFRPDVDIGFGDARRN